MKMNSGVWFRLGILSLMFIGLLHYDYQYHEELVRTSFKNYEWLAYFKYFNVAKAEFIYSVDVIVGTILFLGIIIFAFKRKRVSNLALVIFPITFLLLHYLPF